MSCPSKHSSLVGAGGGADIVVFSSHLPLFAIEAIASIETSRYGIIGTNCNKFIQSQLYPT